MMLKLQDVRKTYNHRRRTVQAVCNVTLSVEAGEMVAIQGASGCGKTTLLLIAGTLLRPSQGTVNVAGTEPYELNANLRSAFRAQQIGFVFQQFHLIPYLSVLQNVLTANVAHPRPDSGERAEELIRHFGLEHRLDHLPAELSVGEKQRLALARALFNEPQLLLADEPTGNLDPDNGLIVLQALRDYAEQGAAVLMVTHDPRVSEQADRVERMDQGQIVTGTPTVSHTSSPT